MGKEAEKGKVVVLGEVMKLGREQVTVICEKVVVYFLFLFLEVMLCRCSLSFGFRLNRSGRKVPSSCYTAFFCCFEKNVVLEAA